jgi:hypothetical protein
MLAVVALACVSCSKPRNSETDSSDVELAMQPDAQSPSSQPLDRSQPPPPGENRPYALPDLAQSALDNGLTIILINRPAFPTVSARLSIRAGRDVAGADVAVAELTARTLRDGTTTRTAQQIADLVDGNGIDFCVDVAANQVVLRADALSSALPQVLLLLADLVANPTFPDDRVASRREERVAQLAVASAEPSFHRDRMMRRVAFGSHPYATLYPTVEAVQAITATALRDFHAANYGPGRATLVLVGALPDDIQTQLAQTLGAWSRDVAPTSRRRRSRWRPAMWPTSVDSAQTSIMAGVGAHDELGDVLPGLVGQSSVGGGPARACFSICARTIVYAAAPTAAPSICWARPGSKPTPMCAAT